MNPYKRIQEIDAELEVLGIQEIEFKKKVWKRKPRELENIESEIMFLCFEKRPIEKTIKWFEDKRRNTTKEEQRN